MEANEDRTVQTQLTITEFLGARIAEDEEELERFFAKDYADDFAYGGTDDYHQFTIGYGRALAECAAKRAIIEQWTDPASFGPFSGGVEVGIAEGIDTAVHALAAVYKDHPDYREEWA